MGKDQQKLRRRCWVFKRPELTDMEELIEVMEMSEIAQQAFNVHVLNLKCFPFRKIIRRSYNDE
ncbi:MAG: hypothetical protein LBS02_18275 [Hungatella sp.]|nr:hypothetical protein [Hungatella sp.]